MIKTLIITGHGKLAKNINNKILNYLSDYQIDFWENKNNYSIHDMIIVHIGSGRQLQEVIEFCCENKIPLIQGSTGMNIKETDFDFTFIDAPNLSLLMLKFMYMLKEYGYLFKDYNITITESHQSTKKTVPGTAIQIADFLEADSKEIISIRNQDQQENIYGINKKFLSLHALHNISIQDESTVISFKALVEGHDSYIKGLSKIILCVNSLKNKYYHILDLIEMNLV